MNTGQDAAASSGEVEGVTYIVDPADPRLDDYRELNSIAVRAEMEADDYFMGEGYVPIDRMLDSGHRMRSVRPWHPGLQRTPELLRRSRSPVRSHADPLYR